MDVAFRGILDDGLGPASALWHEIIQDEILPVDELLKFVVTCVD